MVPPEALTHYLEMWNAPVESAILDHARAALEADFYFVDPNDEIRGSDAFARFVVDQREIFPEAVFRPTSALDGHHNLVRYTWRRTSPGIEDLDGLDIASFGPSGRLDRVLGFFEHQAAQA